MLLCGNDGMYVVAPLPSLQLCSQCRFKPEAYLQYKRLLVSEFRRQRSGKLRLAEARKLLKIDVNKTRKIYNLLVAKNLIIQ